LIKKETPTLHVGVEQIEQVDILAAHVGPGVQIFWEKLEFHVQMII